MQPLLGAFIFLVSFLLYEIFIIQKKKIITGSKVYLLVQC